MGEITEALRRAKEADANRRPPADRDRERDAEPVAHGGPVVSTQPAVAISLDREADWPARAIVVEPRGPVAEALRHLALRIRAELDRRKTRSFAVTSPLRGEGKSTLSCDLALALASLSRGRNVAIVDFDLRRPSVARVLRLHPTVGIESHLAGQARLESVCIPIEHPALDVYPALVPQDVAHELLVRPQAAALIKELERRYQTVVYDTPPSVLVPDTRILLAHLSAYVVVARHGATRRRALQHMLSLLPREQLLGAVMNGGPGPAHSRHYGYYTEDRPRLEEPLSSD